MGMILGSGTTKPTYPYDQWYGVRGDLLSSDYKLTRVGNLDLHRTLPVQSLIRRFVENADGSVKYYLHQNDSRITSAGAPALLDSTDGNVMLEIPEHYFKVEWNGTKWTRMWSIFPLPGFVKIERQVVSPWYGTIDLTNNKAVSGCWLKWNADNSLVRDANGYIELLANAAQFRGGSGATDAALDGTYNSQLGMARTSVAKATVRPLCLNGTHIGAYRAYNTLRWLQRCEYASLHCQDTYNAALTADGFRQGGLGSGPAVVSGEWNAWGVYKPFAPCGITANLGNNTGRVSYTIKGWTGGDKVVEITSYRGLEAPYEYLWLLADDVLIRHIDGGKSLAYLCTDPTKFTSHTDGATTVPAGYVEMTELPRNDGSIKEESHHEKGYSFPMKIGGAANTYFCDSFYTSVDDPTPTYGWFGALFSGFAGGGTPAGFGYTHTYLRSSYAFADDGFRLCRF
ncbi:MAG: hypothetical protein AB2L20_12010 [Mangrovibacterium sp.]